METSPTPPLVPAYNKPEKPGIWMNFDNTVSIFLAIGSHVTFEQAAQDTFEAVREAQTRYPDWPRVCYIDIAGHRDGQGRFEAAFIEFQQEFWFSVIAPFLTGFDLPLTGALLNPSEQRNDLPDALTIEETD